MKIYLAGPFFNDQQVLLVKDLENFLESKGHRLYSPMKDGGLLKKGDSPSTKVRIFAENVGAIKWSDLVVAIIDDRDSGTIWEMGYAFGINKPVIAFTNKGYGLNVMLTEAVYSFCKDKNELEESLNGNRRFWSGDVQ